MPRVAKPVRISKPPQRSYFNPALHLREVTEGWRFILGHAELRPLFLNTVLVNALIMATAPLMAVLTDLRMPGMVDGLEVLRVQNELSPRTKTILVTAYGSNQIKFQAATLGAVYLDKPVQLDDLLVHVRQLTSP